MILKKYYPALIIMLVVVSVGTTFLIQSFSQPKIYYVKTDILIESYVGTHAARKAMQEKISELQKKFDIEKKAVLELEEKYENQKASTEAEGLEDLKAELRSEYLRVDALSKDYEVKVQDQEDKLLDGVFNQINSFLDEYSKQKGIDLIIGTTDAGNVLYGGKSLDITEDVLYELNKNFEDEI